MLPAARSHHWHSCRSGDGNDPASSSAEMWSPEIDDRSHLQPRPQFCFERFSPQSFSRGLGVFCYCLRARSLFHSSAGVQLLLAHQDPGRASLQSPPLSGCRRLLASSSYPSADPLAAVMPEAHPAGRRSQRPAGPPVRLPVGRRSGETYSSVWGGQLWRRGCRWPLSRAARQSPPTAEKKRPPRRRALDRTAGLPQISAAVLFRWI